MHKNKREKPEDFIGWKSEDGLLEVVDMYGKQGTNAIYKVICHKCKEDKELFPLGYFITTKGNLLRGRKPCGCSKKTNWNKEQYLVLSRRAGKGRFIVHGYAEEYHGQKTKLNLECLIDGHKWIASLNNIINSGIGCTKCSGLYRLTEQEAFEKCKEICEIEGYKHIGFVGRYKNVNKTRFEYKCPTHGIQNISYNSFVYQGSRCKGCWKDRQKELGSLYGYYPKRKHEADFLYVLNFKDKFIKVGRSFDVNERMKKLRTKSKVPIKKIHKLRIFTATHQEIYDVEQELHSELRERNFQHYVNWSTECFTSDSLPYLNMLLDKCGLEEVKL